MQDCLHFFGPEHLRKRAMYLVVVDELLQFVSMDHDVQTTHLGQTELFPFHTGETYLEEHTKQSNSFPDQLLYHICSLSGEIPSLSKQSLCMLNGNSKMLFQYRHLVNRALHL